MAIPPRGVGQAGGRGFTLLEMLLTMALLLALLGAVVFNFGSLQRGADLEEGGRQFQALVRFAGSQAANSGRTIQFRFGEEAGTTNATEDPSETANHLRMVWEVDPVGQPGVFVDVAEAGPMLEQVRERVRVAEVKAPGRPANQSTNEMSLEAVPAGFAPVSFFPDGSSDTVDIILASQNREDYRRLLVQLEGVTGSMRTEVSVEDELVPLEWMEGEPAQEAAAVAPEPARAPAERPDMVTEPTDRTSTQDPFEDDFPE